MMCHVNPNILVCVRYQVKSCNILLKGIIFKLIYVKQIYLTLIMNTISLKILKSLYVFHIALDNVGELMHQQSGDYIENLIDCEGEHLIVKCLMKTWSKTMLKGFKLFYVCPV